MDLMNGHITEVSVLIGAAETSVLRYSQRTNRKSWAWKQFINNYLCESLGCRSQ